VNTSRNPDQIDELSLKERGEVLAPLVKLILLTHNPGDWLEEVLLGIAAQDYLSLDITVIDTTRRESIEKQVKSILPESSILHLKNSPGFSALTPKNLDTERNCLFYFFVTDDLVLDATAVRRVVESALEMNAGVTGLKVVGGENTELLQDVGSSIDRYGTTVARHQLNEIDQGQYDGKREVFAASSSAFLVRKDLFETVGGFDPLLGLVDGHTDLCWRARLVGANIVLSPNAVGRSTITSESQGRRRRRRVDPTRFGPRHRIRMIWTNRKISRAIMLSFELLIITVLGTIYGLVRGRFRHVLSLLSAWTWNLRHLRSIRSRRLFIFNKERSLDHDISIDAPSHAFRRAATGRDPNQRTTESNLLIKIQNFWMALFGPGGLALIFGIAVLGFGSRHLLTRGLPAIGRFQPIPENPLDLFYSWWEGWRPTAGGMLDSGVDALALLGGLGWLLPMNSETVMAIAVLSAFPLGAFGIWQLVQPIGGGRSRAAAVAIYLAVPTPYHALGEGRFGPLVVYASLPWIIHRLSIAQGVVPYGEKGGTPGPGAVIRSFWADTTALGLLLSLVIFFEPLIVIPTVITFIALLVGSALAGSFAGLLRLVLITIGATAASAIVHFTILIDLINGRSWESWVPNDNWTQGLISPGSIFRFDTGPFGISSLAWAFLIIPAVSLITTNGWRLAIAIRSWFLIAGGFAAVYFVDQGWFTRQAPAAELLIIPAAVGVALASAAGVASLGQEIATKLKRRKYVTAVLFAGALVLVIIPVVSASLEGRWGLPEKDFSDTVPYLLGEEDANGVPIESTAGRVLWVGAPNLLPAAGIGLEGGIALALTDGYPNIGDQSPYEPSQSEAIEELHAALLRALNGDISRLGERVGVWSVSHIVLMENSAPIPYGDNESLLPEKYFLALTRQLDLERVEGLNRSLEIFSNTAVEPIHAVVRDSTGRSVPSEVKKTGYASIEVQSIVDGSYRWRLSPVDEWEFSSITGASNEVQLGPQGEPTVRMASGSIGQLSLTETDNSSDRMLQMIILLAVLLLTSWSHSERKKYQS
tara:strand:- start:978 stop:4109 length:3132 start_codon:yes stop_codon:yes gene_type:complete